MQTDPNPANFLYDESKKRMNLIDFGSGRAYDPAFIDGYMGIVSSAFMENREQLMHFSKKIGFVTGEESRELMDAHYKGALAVAMPFRWSQTPLYDFGNESVAKYILDQVPTITKQSLRPPPQEAYAIHRKIFGSYLMCIKLKSRVPARKLFLETYQKWLDHLQISK